MSLVQPVPHVGCIGNEISAAANRPGHREYGATTAQLPVVPACAFVVLVPFALASVGLVAAAALLVFASVVVHCLLVLPDHRAAVLVRAKTPDWLHSDSGFAGSRFVIQFRLG